VRDVRRFVELIYTRDSDVYDRHGIEPPRKDPAAYQRLAREAYGDHALLPTDRPEDLLDAEGFVLIALPGAGCGVSTRDMIAIRRTHDRRLGALLLHHERTHGWAKRMGWRGDEATEADIWLATGELCLPGKYGRRADLLRGHPYLPWWFLALALRIEAA
jgi:hypothetical protein